MASVVFKSVDAFHSLRVAAMEGDLNWGVNANFESRDFNFGEFLIIHWTCLVQSGLSDVSANCKDCCRALIELTSMFDSWQVTAVNPTEDG